jgi:hypothetical protein
LPASAEGPPLKSDEFIREVDEELQRDKLKALWDRFGSLVIALAVLLVVGVAGYEGWKAWQRSQRHAEAERFAAAEADLAAQRWQAAASAFDSFAADASPGYGALARLREAAALEGAGDTAGAAAALDRLAADSGADPLLRDLATLLSVSAQVDTGDPQTLRGRLLPLAEAGRPWRSSARELLALLAIRTGEIEQARSTLEDLAKDGALPLAQQQRVEALRQSLGAPAS